MTTDTREQSRRWVEDRLRLMLTEEAPDELADRAEVLVALAERYEAPIEALIEWIDRKAPDKQWSAVEWRRFCEFCLRPPAGKRPA